MSILIPVKLCSLPW